MKRSIALLVFAASLALALLPSVAAAQKPVTVRVGTIGIVDDIGMLIAMDRGYFAEKGVKVETVSISAGGDVMAMLATNQLEAVGGGYNVGLFNAIARGLPIRAVSPRALLIPGHDLEAILVRPDLAGSIKSVADLKGRKFSINAPTSPLVYIMGKIMESAGLSIKDLDMVNMPFPNMGTAFSTKAIEAAMSVEPFVTLFAEKGTVVKWKGPTDFLTNPHVDIGAYFINHDWAQKNPRAMQDFVTQLLRGTRVYYEVLTTGKGRDEVITLLAKYTPLKDRSVYERMPWAFIHPNGTMSRRSIEDQIDWYFGKSMITKKLPVNEVLDARYVDRAVKDLGSVACPKCPF